MKRILALLLAFAATAAPAQTTTSVSRLQLAHPDLGFPGGVPLHDALAALYTKIGDNMNSRYSEYTSVPQNTLTTVTDNLGIAFAQKLVILYQNTGNTKTLISNPSGSGWVIAANGTNPTTQIDVTTPPASGAQTFTLEVIDGLHGMAVQDPSAVAITGGSIAGTTHTNSNTYTAKDGANFTVQNASDTTKQARLDLSGLTTGNTRTYTLPDASTTLVGTATTQTLTNKTLSGDTATNLVNGSGTTNFPSTGTITIPGATDTLLGKATTDNLTNKTLLDTTTSVANAADATKKYVWDLSGATSAKTMTLASPHTNNRTLTLPDATDTLVGRATVDTLTNKTLSGNTAATLINGSGTLSLNSTGTITVPGGTDTLVARNTTDTLTNKTLDDTNAATVKDGSFTLENTSTTTKKAVFDLSGITAATTRTYTVPDASTTLVGTGTTQTLTNKTLTAPVQSSFEDMTEIATPATPGAGVLRLYSKSGDGLYIKNSGGTESQLSTSSTASPTTSGIVTSYFPVIQSAVNNVSSAGYTVTTTDGYEAILVTTANVARTVTLPAASANAGRRLVIKKVDSGTGTVTVARAGSDTIDALTSFVLLNQYDMVSLYSDGSTTWNVLTSKIITGGTSADVTGVTEEAGTTTGLVRHFFKNSDRTRSFEIDGDFTSGSESLLFQSDSSSLLTLPRSTSVGSNGRAGFGNGYFGNVPFIYTFGNLTGVTSTTSFTTGSTRASGSGISVSGSTTATFTLANAAGWYKVTVEMSTTYPGASASQAQRFVVTLGGTATRINASANVGTADNKISWASYDGNGDAETFSDTFYVQVPDNASHNTLTVAATAERVSGAGTITAGLSVAIVPI